MSHIVHIALTSIIAFAVVATLAAAVAYRATSSAITRLRNKLSKVRRVHARVVRRKTDRLDLLFPDPDISHPGLETEVMDSRVTYEVDGSQFEFKVPAGIYLASEEKSEGTLIYRGSHVLSFTRTR
jgi:hypothetical protein